MPQQESLTLKEKAIKAQVSEGLKEAKQFAKTLSFDEVKNGQ